MRRRDSIVLKLLSCSLNADRAPQLKARVRRLRAREIMPDVGAQLPSEGAVKSP